MKGSVVPISRFVFFTPHCWNLDPYFGRHVGPNSVPRQGSIFAWSFGFLFFLIWSASFVAFLVAILVFCKVADLVPGVVLFCLTILTF